MRQISVVGPHYVRVVMVHSPEVSHHKRGRRRISSVDPKLDRRVHGESDVRPEERDARLLLPLLESGRDHLSYVRPLSFVLFVQYSKNRILRQSDIMINRLL